MNPDLSKYPLPDEYEWTYHTQESAISIRYKGAHKPKEIQDTRSEAWLMRMEGKFNCHCRASTGKSTEDIPVTTSAPTLDEALQYIYTWVMLGMNRSGG